MILTCALLLVTMLHVCAGTYALVADGGNHRVAEFYVTGSTWSFVGSFVNDTTVMTTANGVLASLNAPNSVVQDQQGRIYISDWNGAGNNRILRFSTNGVFLDIVGTNGLNGFNVPGTGVDDMTLGPDGNIYATLAFGSGNNQILKFDVATTNWSVFYSNSVTLNTPRGLAFGPDGNLYVNSRGNAQMLVFDPHGILLRTNATFSGMFTTTPMGLRWDSTGNRFICSAGNGDSIICTCTTNGILSMVTGLNPLGGPGIGASTLGALALGTNIFYAPYKSSSRVYLCSNATTNIVSAVDASTSPLLNAANYMNLVSGQVSTANSFNTYGDGFWKIINQGNSGALVVGTDGATQATGSTSAEAQQFQLLLNLDDGSYRIRAHDSWLCIGAQNGSSSVGTAVVTISSYSGASSQRWNLVGVGGGYFRIVNVACGLVLQTDSGSPGNVTLQPISEDTRQYWNFSYQTHYPKKGMAGWQGQISRFNASWLYNWGWSSSQSLSASQVFNPMLWGNWGPGGVSATEKPQCVMGFNEPDRSDQANMTTDQAISRWPQLQALNEPLVSPAPANLFGGWLDDFYTKADAKGYRVDFTGVHAYPSSTSASSLISTLQSAYNTWGRPVWLTEFSVVDWSGSHTWSEQDNYKFLAEFMWRAEDLSWFKRYSLFLFSGTPSTNPWDGDGHRSDTFMPNNYTLTPFGELYAAWDADRALRPQTPYFILNKSTCFRMASIQGNSGPSAFSIRHEDASTQWVLTNALASGRYYIQSLADGRRLSYNGGSLSLASPGTTGSTVEWTCDGPDSSGYYYINNPAGNVSLNGSGGSGSVSISAVTAGSPSDNTRWRFIKPYYPISLAAVSAPTTLTVTAADQSVILHWSGTAPRYDIYRSGIPGGPYIRIATDVGWNAYTDNTALNENTYYYVVTSVGGLENESGYSPEATASPAAGLNLGLVAEYKFENNVRDTSGNGLDGKLNGVTSFDNGRVETACITFTGGDNSYVEIPNPLGNDFSISFWIKTTDSGGTGQWWSGDGLIDGEVPGATNDFGVSLAGGNVAFGVGNSDTTITSSSAVNDGQWHNVVATRDGATGAMKIYVDGLLRAAGSGPTGTRSTAKSLHIGNLQTGIHNFAGSIDEVRFYNYALNANEVGTLAKEGSTLVAHYQFAGDTLDSSGFANNGAGVNVSYVTGITNPQAAQFNGGSYVQVPAAVVSDFTITFWIKTTDTGGTGQWWNGEGLVDGEVSGAVNDFGVSLLGDKAAFGVGNPDTTISSITSINDGQWHFVAVNRNNSTGGMKVYVDGALQAAASGPTGVRSAPEALRIGGILAGNAGGFFNGTLDDVRLYNYVLSASQISLLYNPQALPPPWTNTDIGAVGSPGYSAYVSGNWTIGGSGADIWNTSDQFQFAYQTFTGDGSIVVRAATGAINSDGTTNANAKAGIMFRDSTSANAPFVALVHDQGKGLQMLYRDSYGASVGQQGTNIVAGPPVWLKLVRSVGTFTAYYATTFGVPSTNDWMMLGSHATTLFSDALVGMIACSHDNATLANVIYSGVSVTSAAPVTLHPPVFVGGNLTLTGSGGTPGGGYTLLTSTNLQVPLAAWRTNVIGTLDGSGAFSNVISVNFSEPVRFFNVRSP
jgi:hypothetical protein